jgi:hypothetical protein
VEELDELIHKITQEVVNAVRHTLTAEKGPGATIPSRSKRRRSNSVENEIKAIDNEERKRYLVSLAFPPT